MMKRKKLTNRVIITYLCMITIFITFFIIQNIVGVGMVRKVRKISSTKYKYEVVINEMKQIVQEIHITTLESINSNSQGENLNKNFNDKAQKYYSLLDSLSKTFNSDITYKKLNNDFQEYFLFLNNNNIEKSTNEYNLFINSGNKLLENLTDIHNKINSELNMQMSNLSKSAFIFNMVQGSFFLLLIIINVYLAFKFSNIIVSPIKKISDQIKNSNSTDHQKIKLQNNSIEIQQLIDSYNKMLEDIDISNNKITLINDELINEVEQKETAELELKKTQEFLQNTINILPMILISTNKDKKILLWNDKAENYFNIRKEYALEKKFKELLPDFHIIISKIDQLNSSKSEEILLKKERIVINDNVKFFDINILKTTYDDVVYTIQIIDLTEKLHIEEVMIQTEKMMSVGGLAAGMAHEINNPLGIIIQGIQNTLRRINVNIDRNIAVAESLECDINKVYKYLETQNIIQYLEGIKQSSIKASHIIHSMLQFSKNRSSERSMVGITTLIDNILELLQNDYDIKKNYDFKNIRILKNYQTNDINYYCSPTEFEQIFFNLFKNAAEAIHEKSQTVKFTPEISISIYEDEESLKIEIFDNGIGIDDEERKRIFEPFYTTKSHSSGTGLGLAVIYFIINKTYKGSITLLSEKYKYTKFNMTFPK